MSNEETKDSRAEKRKLLAKLASADSFAEKRELISGLAALDNRIVASNQEEREVDWTAMKTIPRFEPVHAYSTHSTESDWMEELNTTAAADYSTRIHAEASMWYNHLDSDVKADRDEFAEQAKGAAQRVAGSMGERADAAEQEFIAYVSFLNRQAASGLSQINQEYDAKDNYAPTPYPTETFDTFSPEVQEAEMGSDRAPMLSDIAPNGTGPGRPSEHDTNDKKLNDAPNDNWPETKTGPGSQSGTPSSHQRNASLSLWDGIDDGGSSIEGFDRIGDAANFSQGTGSPIISVEAAGRSQEFWENFKKKIKDRIYGPGKHRKDTSPKHREVDEGPKHRKVKESPKHRKDEDSVGKHRKQPGKHRDTPSRSPEAPQSNQRVLPKGNPPTADPKAKNPSKKPVTVNHPSSPGRHRKSDPLSDPGHKVKDVGTSIHDQLKKEKANPLTDPHHKVKDTGTPLHEKTKDKRKKTDLVFSHANLNPRESASGLDQIEQVVDVHDQEKTTPLPSDVAFPINPEWDREHPNHQGAEQAEDKRKEAFVLAAKLMEQASELMKQADMWGSSDAPHSVPGGDVPNNPGTTPARSDGTYEEGFSDGQADKSAGNNPAFTDASSTTAPYVQGYSKGYSAAEMPSGPKNVPVSLGGDNGQAFNSRRVEEKNHPVRASLRVASAFVNESAFDSSDFRKGYNYGRKWTEGSPLVRQGSSDFEAGLYAGITDNPENQKAFVEANRKHEVLEPRLATHRDFTYRLAAEDEEVMIKGLYVQSATSTDLDTLSPSSIADPMGSTPIMGPGTVPPHAGVEDPARPGGPAPYNAAEPLGHGPVVPNPVVGPEQEDAHEVRDNPKLAAFIAQVQENYQKGLG